MAESARVSWLAVVLGVQSTDSGGWGWPPPSTAGGYSVFADDFLHTYNTTAKAN